MANVKLSQIASGSQVNVATDAVVAVRGGASDVLVTLAASAQTDTTSASNITSGTLPVAQLPSIPNTSLANSSVTISGHSLALGGALSLSASDVSLGSVTNDAQTKAAIVPNTAPSAGQILVGNAGGTAYAPQSVSGDIAVTSAGAATVNKINGAAVPTIPASNKFLTSDGSQWVATYSANQNLQTVDSPTFGGLTLGSALTIGNGGTGQTSAAAGFNALSPLTASGDILYGGTSGAGTRLAANSTATKKYLQSLSSGVPSWQQVAAGDISGLAASATTDTTNATNIGSGTLNAARLPATVVQTGQANTFTTGIQYLNGATLEEAVYSAGNSGTSLTIAFDNGNLQSTTITGAVTIALTAPTHAGRFTLIATQDGTGHVYSITGVKWAGGTIPVYSTAAGKIDIFSFIYDGSSIYGMAGIAFS